MCGCCCLSEFSPVSELLPPACFKVRNSTSTRKMRGMAEDWEERGMKKLIRHICKEYKMFLVTVGFYGAVMDAWAGVLKDRTVCCAPLPSLRQVKTDFSTTAISLGYVRCKACLVQSQMRKLLISAWKLQYTSTIRHQALVLAVINLLQLSKTGMLCIFVCRTVYTAA